MEAIEVGEDDLGRFGPDERLGRAVVLVDVVLDGVLQVGNGFEDPAPDALSCDGREKAFDGVEPGRRGWCEMEDPARMIGEPLPDLGVLVGGIILQWHILNSSNFAFGVTSTSNGLMQAPPV